MEHPINSAAGKKIRGNFPHANGVFPNKIGIKVVLFGRQSGDSVVFMFVSRPTTEKSDSIETISAF